MRPRVQLVSGAASASIVWQDLSELVSALDQGTGAAVAPVDAGGIGTTGTGYNSSTGQFDLVCGTHIVAVDGYREDLLFWTVPLVDIWDDYDPAGDEILIGVDFSNFPGASNGYGVAVGLGDRALAGQANLNASLLGVRQFGTTNHQAASLAATGASATASVGVIDQMRCFLQGLPQATSTSRHQGYSAFQVAASPGLYDIGVNTSSPPAFQSDETAHRLYVCVYHVGTTDLAGKTGSWNVKLARRTRPTLPFP